MEIVTLPAVGLSRGGWIGFLLGILEILPPGPAALSRRRPKCVLAMGGFTSAPPVVGGQTRAARKTFLHESNSIPGPRQSLAGPVGGRRVCLFSAGGGPVARATCGSWPACPCARNFYTPLAAAEARRPWDCWRTPRFCSIMGGSQGATESKRIGLEASFRNCAQAVPDLQFMHLTGPGDFEKVRAGYAAHRCRPWFTHFFTTWGRRWRRQTWH